MLNRVILIGRLTRDPELKRTGNTGVALTNFTLAVDRKFKSANGERETDFIRVVCWDKLAEHCNEYLAKGNLTAVEGQLQVRNWETPQGERRTIMEVRADDVRFLEWAAGGKKKTGERDSSSDEDGYTDRYEKPARGNDRYEKPARRSDSYEKPSRGKSDFSQGGDPDEKLFPGGADSRSGGKKDYGNVSDKTLDEEIDLDDDDPFKEEF